MPTLFLLDFRVNELGDEGAEMPLSAQLCLICIDATRSRRGGAGMDHKSEDVQF